MKLKENKMMKVLNSIPILIMCVCFVNGGELLTPDFPFGQLSTSSSGTGVTEGQGYNISVTTASTVVGEAGIPLSISIGSTVIASSGTLVTTCLYLVTASTDGTNAALLNQTDNTCVPMAMQITSFQSDFFSSTGAVTGTGTIVFSTCSAANYPTFSPAVTMVFSNTYSTSTTCNLHLNSGDYVQAKRTVVGGGVTNMSKHYGKGIKLP